MLLQQIGLLDTPLNDVILLQVDLTAAAADIVGNLWYRSSMNLSIAAQTMEEKRPPLKSEKLKDTLTVE